MSEFESAGCNGSCDSCCSDCETDGKATVTLTLDDGTVLECAILTVFPCGEKEYIALLPLDENGENEDGEVFLYRFSMNGEIPQLENIEEDSEYEAVADAFDEWLDNQEFDEMDPEADENE